MKKSARYGLFFALLAVAVYLVGGYAKDRTNAPLAASDTANAEEPDIFREYRPQEAGVTEGRALLGIAISGGGSRAANFSASVLSELDRLGILENATVISSVSGGSLASSYFVTHQNDPQRKNGNLDAFWKVAEERLSQDFLSTWKWSVAGLARTMAPNVTRSALMADILDRAFLAGTSGGLETLQIDDAAKRSAPKGPSPGTFGSLPSNGPRLLINATAQHDAPVKDVATCINRGSNGQTLRFEGISFSESLFRDCLLSDRSTYRIADAVMASAAFPGVFNSITLKSYADAQTSHLHLIDGGPSDNLGIDAILHAASGRLSGVGSSVKRACLIIVIDAFVRGDADDRYRSSDIRGVMGRAVDVNFLDAIDAMLHRRRFDTLQRLGTAPGRLGDKKHQSLEFGLPSGAGRKTILMQPVRYREDVALNEALGEHYEATSGAGAIEGLTCDFWHIGLDNIESLQLGQHWDGTSMVKIDSANAVTRQRWFEAPSVKNRIAVGEVTSRLKTNFQLEGPSSCTHSALKDAVWEAGRLSVIEDYASRQKACAWLDRVGWGTSTCAKAPDDQHRRRELAIEYRALAPQGHTVACR